MRVLPVLRLPSGQGKPIIALTGAGGKSALLFRLGQELADAGRQVLLTTTTRLWRRQMDQAPLALEVANPALLAEELPVSLRGYRQALVLAGPASEPGKVQGLTPEIVCALAGLAEVQAVVVEADGSRELSLKAPGAHEPAVPPCATHVIVVASMAAVNKPLDETWVHRPQVVARLTGLPIGAAMTPQAIAELLLHNQGGRKGWPAGAQGHLYLNLSLEPAVSAEEVAERWSAARAIARQVTGPVLVDPLAGAAGLAKGGGPAEGGSAAILLERQPSYTTVMIGNARGREPVDEMYGRVAGIVLAAGRSSRLQSQSPGSDLPKQLLPWGSQGTLVEHVVDTALASRELSQVIVVVGYRGEEIAAALAPRPVRIVRNDDWAQGQSTSVRVGIQALAPEVQAAVFLLADQPDVHSDTVAALVQTHRRTATAGGCLAAIVAPLYHGGQRGNPVLFDRELFAELSALQGDMGGRQVIARRLDDLLTVPIDQPLPQDIDTWADYNAHGRSNALPNPSAS